MTTILQDEQFGDDDDTKTATIMRMLMLMLVILMLMLKLVMLMLMMFIFLWQNCEGIIRSLPRPRPQNRIVKPATPGDEPRDNG